MLKANLRTIAISAVGVVLASLATSASAHMVQFGWKETSTGTVLWAEHWHGSQTSAYSDNGGLHITDVATGQTITAQWTGVMNATPKSALGLTGSQCDPVNAGCDTENNWMFTNAVPLGNGVYDFFTGTNCCQDTMGAPVRVTITGITAQPPGIGSAVPEPTSWALMLLGFGATGLAMRRRRVSWRATPQLA